MKIFKRTQKSTPETRKGRAFIATNTRADSTVSMLERYQMSKAKTAASSTQIQPDKVVSQESVDVQDRGLKKRPYDPEILLALYGQTPSYSGQSNR